MKNVFKMLFGNNFHLSNFLMKKKFTKNFGLAKNPLFLKVPNFLHKIIFIIKISLFHKIFFFFENCIHFRHFIALKFFRTCSSVLLLYTARPSVSQTHFQDRICTSVYEDSKTILNISRQRFWR